MNKIKRLCDLGVWSGAFSLIRIVYRVYDLQSFQGKLTENNAMFAVFV